MKSLVLLFFVVVNASVFAQTNNSNEPTSRVITEISKGWKKDSTGRHKYRSAVFERLLYSKVDSLSKESLFKALGKPHKISKFFNGNTHKNYVGYQYFVLCLNNYPKERFFVGSYIEFVFDETETKFIEICDGEYCI